MPVVTRALLNKSIKSVCVDTILFFALFALIGHLSINFWERYAIQRELSTMKHSLCSLTKTITNIEKAYDSLNVELKDLFTMVDKRQIMVPKYYQQNEADARSKNANSLNRKKLHNPQVQTVIHKSNKRKHGIGVRTDNDKHTESYGREHKATGPKGEHTTTNTRNSLTSTGITSDMSKYEREHTKNDSESINSYQNYLRFNDDFNHCRHVCHRANTEEL